ncbi:MAG: carboxypeptidase-like regulatory domain-containing protein [Phycisphaerales bacterium]|jgi:hypothetical protein
MTLRTRAILLSALAIAAVLLPGCQTPRLEGVVVPGRLGVVAVIDDDDARLDQVGIPDARVRVRLTGNGRMLVDTTTDEEGRFSVPTSGEQMARGTVRVIVEADGYARIDRQVPLRSFYRSLYITMVEHAGASRADDDAGDAETPG